MRFVLLLSVLVTLIYVTSAANKRLPGVGCLIRCQDDCQEKIICKKSCKKLVGRKKKMCKRGCRNGKCGSCKQSCFKEAKSCQQQNCQSQCPENQPLGPRQIKTKFPQCFQCLVANCLMYD